MYCSPRADLENGNYASLELGYPSEMDEIISEYAEEPGICETVFPYVPINVVEELLKKHGGIFERYSLGGV